MNYLQEVQDKKNKRKKISENIRKEKKSGLVKDAVFPDEIEHLSDIQRRIRTALEESIGTVEQYDMEYKKHKKYMADNRHEIDPHEMFRSELDLKEIDTSGRFAVQVRDRLLKIEESPYFARIDFKLKGEGEEESPAVEPKDAEVYYIGRFSFAQNAEILIFDWRAPISGMFYDCELGSAHYEAPNGRIEGDLIRKRQFSIKHGAIEYALETSLSIRDNVLQRELSRTSDEKMKTIISTIQQEQNQIIRDEKADCVIIQGAAGSGKTSIALHRIAYLLYRFKNSLQANNVVIISPNKIFGDYISNVLPELGEEPTFQISFAELAEIQIENKISFADLQDAMEVESADLKERMKFKLSLDFLRCTDDYLHFALESYFCPEDYNYGRFKAEAKWIHNRFRAYKNMPVKKRLEEIAADILSHFESENWMEEELPKRNQIYNAIKKFYNKKSTLELYKDFYNWMKMPDYLKISKGKTLEWDDMYPFLYFQNFFEGLKENRLIKHLIIDEMQDYSPIQYAVIDKLFQCKKTILGDFNQKINPYLEYSLQDFQMIMKNSGEIKITKLNKSYRSTYEIIMFAKKIMNISELDPVERHGEKPAVIGFESYVAELENLIRQIQRFRSGRNTSLGIILKSNSTAKEVYNSLKNRMQGNNRHNNANKDLNRAESSQLQDIYLLDTKSTAFHNGISVTSVQLSKGLEFDEIVIPFADDKNYVTQYDRQLIYIACTRAMHKLMLTYSDTICPFLNFNKNE